MDLTTLKAHIKTGKFDPYYIFTGEDSGVQRIYLQQMAKVRNAEVKILDSITELGAKKQLRTTLKNACICVLFDSKEFIQDERIELFIMQFCASDDMLVVFIYTSIDKRTKFYKAHQDKIVDFPHLKTDVLVKYVQKDMPLSESSAICLIEACEHDYGRILIEMDKIRCMGEHAMSVGKSSGYDADEVLKYLFRHRLIYRPPQDAVFDFVDAVLKNKRAEAFDLLAESYASGEATLVILTNLFNSARQLLQVQSYVGQNKLTDVTGLTPFQIKLASGRKHYYDDTHLMKLMELVREAERGIKIGEIEDSAAVPYVLVQFWS